MNFSLRKESIHSREISSTIFQRKFARRISKRTLGVSLLDIALEISKKSTRIFCLVADFVARRDRSKGSHSVSQISPRRGCRTRVSRSIKKERVGDVDGIDSWRTVWWKKNRRKKRRRIEKKIAAVKNNEDVLESDTNNVCGTFPTEIVMSERNDIGRGIEESP